jgi:hypothetical protein
VSIGTEIGTSNLVRICKTQNHLLILNIPYAGNAIPAGRNYLAAIGAESHGVDPIAMREAGNLSQIRGS